VTGAGPSTPGFSRPFVVGDAVTGRHFFDRRSHLRVLRDAVRDPTRDKVVIQGARRIGKSSLLQQFLHETRISHSCAYLDALKVVEANPGLHPAGELGRQVLLSLYPHIEQALHLDRETLPRELTVERIRGHVLPAIRAHLRGRLVLLLDEMEVVQELDPAGFNLIVRAFERDPFGTDIAPLLLIGIGRTIGRPSSQPTPASLKGAETALVEPFNGDEARQALCEPTESMYRWTDMAVTEALSLVGAGGHHHPLYISAIGAAIYKARQNSGGAGLVDVDEVRAALEPSIVESRHSLYYAWDQLPVESRLAARAVAEADAAGRPAALADVLRELRARISGAYDFTDIHKHILRPLIDNYVLVEVDGGYRVWAPLLCRFIRHQRYEDIIASENTPERPRAQASFELGRTALWNGQLADAEDAFQNALRLLPTFIDAELALAEVDEARGHLDAALARVKVRHLTSPTHEGAADLYRRLSVRRARAALTADAPPDVWLEPLLLLPPESRRQEENELIRDAELARWRACLAGEPPTAWRAATERLAELPSGWQSSALHTYSEALRRARTGGAPRQHALSLALTTFPVLVRAAPPVSMEEMELQAVTARLQALHQPDHPSFQALAVVRYGLGQLDAPETYTPWALTLELLATDSRDANLDELALPRLFAELSLQVHPYFRDRFHRLIGQVLPGRLEGLLERHPEEAVVAVRLLALHDDIGWLCAAEEALEFQILQLQEAADAVVLRFLAVAPSLFAQLFDGMRRQPPDVRHTLAARLVDQLHVLLSRARIKASLHGGEPIEGVLLARIGPVIDDFHRLLARLGGLPGVDVRPLEKLLQIPAGIAVPTRRTMDLDESEVSRRDHETIHRLLGNNVQVLHRRPFEVPGMHTSAVRLYETTRNNEKILVRLYDLIGRLDSEKHFLRSIWETEYRALYSLSTRWPGRALTTLRHATYDQTQQILALATDFVGHRTLRDALDGGRLGLLAEHRRWELWRHLGALLQAVGSLHRAQHFHRALRPETIDLDEDAEQQEMRPWLRLGHFEWSVYVRALARVRPAPRQYLDRYLAPEVLAKELNAADAPARVGEGFLTDIYALGLVVFECLIRPLTPLELRRYHAAEAYSYREHVAWVEQLREEARRARHGELLDVDELQIVLDLLVGELDGRVSDLDDVISRAEKLARRSGGLASRLKDRRLTVITTLRPGTDESIAKYLRPEIHIPADDKLTEAWLSEFLQHALNDVEVSLNMFDRERPLYLRSRTTTLAFTLKPYVHADSVRCDDLGFLEVARPYHRPLGAPLARLTAGMRVRSLDKNRDLGSLRADGGSWAEVFAVAMQRYDYLGPDLRRFHRTIELTVDVERELWSHAIYPYRIVGTRTEESHEFVDICERHDKKFAAMGLQTTSGATKRGRQSMVKAVEQLLDREMPGFELSRVSDPAGRYDDTREWMYWKVTDEGNLQLRRRRQPQNQPPPGQGYLRPRSLLGNVALARRRKQVLDDLRDDAFLLRAIVQPEAVAQNLGAETPEFIDKKLDANKQALVQSIWNTRPLFVVQGPPGTGKTTLAAEVILQTLHDNPSARILVTSQAHNPLDNLLVRVQAALEIATGKSHQKTVSVRLLPQERLDESRYDEESRKLWRQFNASRRATEMLDDCLRAGPVAGRTVLEDPEKKPSVYDRWRQLVGEQQAQGNPASLAARVVRCANLVYATINDRQLHDLTGEFFDLVIIEEAARAYPIEILAVMRHARRWLLIGDQQQLPPFGHKEFSRILDRRLKNVLAEPPDPQTGRRESVFQTRDSAEMPLKEELLGYDKPEEIVDAALHWLYFFDALWKSGEQTRIPLSGRLDAQWRMHPDLGDLVRETFYPFLRNGDEGFLRKNRAHSLDAPEPARKSTMVWLDVPSCADERTACEYPGFGGGYSNPYEARAIIGFLQDLTMRQSHKFAILSPYRAQVNLLVNLFRDWKHEKSGDLSQRIYTVDSFQGRQADVVILSLVRNNEIEEEAPGKALGFLTERSRATVMFSRAERLLIVAGCKKMFERFTNYEFNDVREFIETHPHGRIVRAETYIGRKEIDALNKTYSLHGPAARKRRASEDPR